jgi:hypothetical protein
LLSDEDYEQEVNLASITCDIPEEGEEDTPMAEFFFTIDNAPSVVAAIRAMDGSVRIPCFAHVTALAVKRVNREVAPVSKWKAKITKVVGHFNSSNEHLRLLKEA